MTNRIDTQNLQFDFPGVYAIINMHNNKMYIGSSVNIKNRLRSHFKSLHNGTHANKNLQAEWNLYGEQGFFYDLLEEVENVGALLVREQLYLDSFFNKNLDLYNICKLAGNTIGFKFSDKTKMHWSNRRKNTYLGDKNPMHGKKHTAETKRKMSINHQNYKGENHPNFGKTLSDKKVVVTNIHTNEEMIFVNAHQASKHLKLCNGNISRAIKYNKIYKGYKIQYVKSN